MKSEFDKYVAREYAGVDLGLTLHAMRKAWEESRQIAWCEFQAQSWDVTKLTDQPVFIADSQRERDERFSNAVNAVPELSDQPVELVLTLPKEGLPPEGLRIMAPHKYSVIHIKPSPLVREISNQQPTKGESMNFGEAQAVIVAGGKAGRAGWNGKGMYIFVVKDWNFNQIGDAEKLPFTALKTVDNKIVPWTVSQTDAHANDWEIIA